MTRRNVDWNEGLAKDLRSDSFVRDFLIASNQEGIPLCQALAKVIRTMGVKKFATRIGMPSSNLLRVINSRHNPTQETLDRLLKPFGLQVGLSVLHSTVKHAA
jgi:DNA-binding phage protein